MSTFVIDLDEYRKRKEKRRLPAYWRPKILETLDLAEAWGARLRKGGVKQVDLAREHCVTPARVSQILKLLELHPRIVAWVRAEWAAGRGVPGERKLRALCDLQRADQLDTAARSLPGFLLRGLRTGS